MTVGWKKKSNEGIILKLAFEAGSITWMGAIWFALANNRTGWFAFFAFGNFLPCKTA